MSNKAFQEIIRAMMFASGLGPKFEDDYFQTYTPDNVANFFNGLCGYFNVSPTEWIFSFNNSTYMSEPSEALRFLTGHKDLFLDGSK